MTVAIIIPWRDAGCEHRRRNLQTRQAWLAQLGWPIILADSDTKDFNRSQARNNGVKQTQADIVIIHDADLHITHNALKDTVHQVTQRGGLRHPYRAVRYLDEAGTQQLLLGNQSPSSIRDSRNAPGGCAIIRRADYLQLGGYDEQYTGWGYEDLDFQAKARASIGQTWGRGIAYHLWHPQAQRDQETQANRERYQAQTRAAKLPKREGPLDVVYRVRPGDNNEELRYSLRTVATHLAHRDVWLIGHKPRWTHNVHHIQGNLNPGKWANVYDNLRIACREPRISDPFILLDDDMFVMADLDQIPTHHRGSLTQQAATQRQSSWDDSIRSTLAYLQANGYDDPISYELHIPYLVHKAEMLKALDDAADWSWPNPPQWRTLDGNVWRRGGTQSSDVKIRPDGSHEDTWVLSSTDPTFAKLYPLMKHRFPTQSCYER